MTIISAKKRQIGTIESNRDVVGPLKFTAAVYWATENSFGSNQMRLSAADDDNKDNAVETQTSRFSRLLWARLLSPNLRMINVNLSKEQKNLVRVFQ